MWKAKFDQEDAEKARAEEERRAAKKRKLETPADREAAGAPLGQPCAPIDVLKVEVVGEVEVVGAPVEAIQGEVQEERKGEEGEALGVTAEPRVPATVVHVQPESEDPAVVNSKVEVIVAVAVEEELGEIKAEDAMS